MRARLLAAWDALQSSYWFIPTVMAAAAAALSVATTLVDGQLGSDWMEDLDWLYANKPEGARTLLSTVAGSMIGVAGVTFSITIASVVYASGQYGPRLLSNFMRDRGNQVTLGTFIATFLYCLLVLRTIRSADENYVGEDAVADATGPFVPHIAILVGLALAVASVAVLIYFIHHVPRSILVSNVIAEVGRALTHRIERRMDEPHVAWPGDPREADGGALGDPCIRAGGHGYVQSVDLDALVRQAEAVDGTIRLRCRPGDFVAAGETLALIWAPDGATDRVRDQVRAAFAWGNARTPLQDVRFQINELVEIAARALSTGVNDPFTAITCLDWLGAALRATGGRDLPSETRTGRGGALRLVARPTTFADLVEAAFGQLRPYLASDRNAALYAMKTLAGLAGAVGVEARGVVRSEAAALVEAATLDARDTEALRERLAVVEALGRGEPFDAIAARTPWLAGSA